MLIKPDTTIENWESYCATSNCFANPMGFLTGTYETCTHIEKIMKKTQSYEELKRELTLYLEDRESFIQQADDIYASGSFKKNPLYHPD